MGFEFKPFSRKQMDSIVNSTAFINILEGSVRSGKTMASIVAWMEFVRASRHTKFLMTGSTSDTLYRNVIEDIEKIMGKRRARFVKSAKGGAKLLLRFRNPNYPVRSQKQHITKICYCVGAHDESSEKRVRGMTVGGWYADEVTLYVESFVKQAINRMSLSGARAFWTCNPDSPYHFIKTEFIDTAASKGYKVWHFELDDNLALDQEYKENIRRAYTGLWYMRMIRGLWVLAEGAVYDMFNEPLHVLDAPKGLRHRIVGVDYGTTNPCTFGLFEWDVGFPVYLSREYWFNSKEAGRQKTDAEYADDMIRRRGDDTPEAVYVDPSAASLIAELRKRRLPVKEANNSVRDGIQFVSKLLADRQFLIDPSCTQTIREFYGYVWDARAQKNGEDKPLKQNDHAMDRTRYGLFSHFWNYVERRAPAPVGVGNSYWRS